MGGGGLVDAGFISLVGAAAGPSGGGWVLPSLSDILMCAVFACLIWLGTAQFSRWFDVPSLWMLDSDRVRSMKYCTSTLGSRLALACEHVPSLQ